MRKIKITVSVIAGLLLCVMLLSSCALFKNEEGSLYIEGQRLNVVATEIEYSDAETAEITLKLTNIASELAFRRDGLVLSESEKSELVVNIDKSVEDLFKEASIGYSLAVELLESIENRLSDGEKTLSVGLFCDLYLLSIGNLGRERASRLTFSATVTYLDRSAQEFRKRYEKYGYEWYLDDAERYEELSYEIKEEIGYERLSDALGVLFFTSSLASGTPLLSGEADFSLDKNELLLLLQKQADYLEENKLTADQWQTVFELVYEIGFFESDAPKELEGVKREEYLALRNCDDYAEKLGSIMPYVTDLYVASVKKLSDERLGRLMSADESVARIELLNSVYMSKNEFFALTSNFSKLCFDSNHEKNALVRAEVYEDYLKYEKHRKPVDSADLYNAIGAYLTGRSEKAHLDAAFENWLFASAPYFTYAFVFDKQD